MNERLIMFKAVQEFILPWFEQNIRSEQEVCLGEQDGTWAMVGFNSHGPVRWGREWIW